VIGGEGRFKSKGRAVDTRQGSKWGFIFTFNAMGYAQIIDYVLCRYKN
jgi:hypothetical protein